MQVPPFWQGLGEQSSMFISQLVPVHPSTHVQMYIATSSWLTVCVCVRREKTGNGYCHCEKHRRCRLNATHSTASIILTWSGSAVINVVTAGGTCPASVTHTGVGIDTILESQQVCVTWRVGRWNFTTVSNLPHRWRHSGRGLSHSH